MGNQHWLIWDGECGLCSASAQYLRRRDPQRKFQIVQYQHCPSPPMTPEIFDGASRALYAVTRDGRILRGADAVFFAWRETGGGFLAAVLGNPPLIWLMRAGYWLVARNRGLISRWFFGGVACGLDNRYPEVE